MRRAIKHKQELIRGWDTRTWRDIYRLIWLLIYLPLYRTHLYFRSGIIFLSKAHALRIMDVGLRKAPCVSVRVILLSTFHISSINYYLVCSLPIHKICALCGILSAISVLLTTEKLRWPWNPGSEWVKVIESYTSEFIMCHFLLAISCIRGRILYRSWDISFDRSIIAVFYYPSCV